ncbi:hypothetical protein U9M48_020093 [Paspalum notatum var. saurae]|uniref:Uncharacterized protein n=1 Tax=Paspalum notatum var. saurae TaxID=547442 RepID=A0AAQ3WS78_PASNO
MGQLCGIRASSNVEIHSRNTELQLKVAVVCHGRSCGSFLSSVRSSVDCVPRRAFSDGSLS